MNSPLFLTEEEVATLTGRKRKAGQIHALKAMGIAFRVNALGKPVVTRSTVEGTAVADDPGKQRWVPAVLQKAA